MLFDPDRHEPLVQSAWDESSAIAAVARIVRDTQARFSQDGYWPLHPADRQGTGDARSYETSLYDGACGVFWALDYLHALGAVQLSAHFAGAYPELLARNRVLLGDAAERNRASYLLGDTPIHMLAFGRLPTVELATALDDLIAGNTEHPARELMTGAPGTLLVALFLHEKTGAERWSELFRLTADRLWSQLEWSTEHECAFWTQNFDRRPSNYLDAVHGFVATVVPLSRGRHLLSKEKWDAWQQCIVNTVQRTADREGAHVNWRPQLDRMPDAAKKLLQFCHGAPGFVICLSDLVTAEIDDLLLAAGETIWSAGPLRKGANLCHGTAGNGYAFLKLYQRTKDARWLQRARAFAMHAIGQAEIEARRHGQLRYSLWTGDLGLAVYLWDCIVGQARFPTLDVFYASRAKA
jgi:lantibiotic modifying enzyme